MNTIATVGKRVLKEDGWHDDNGPISGYPDEWDPPMTDEEVHEAALADPDNPPLTTAQLARMRRPLPAKLARERLRMSRAEFAGAFGIPPDTLAAWERHEAEPTPAELAYLKAIAKAPDAVREAVADPA